MAALARSFEHIERALQVDVEIQSRIVHAGRHCNLGREVINFSRKAYRALDLGGVANVAYRDLQAARVTGCELQ